MSKLVWDKTGERLYETGVDHGVLYPVQSGGIYNKGVAWNGLISVTESPSGAEATPIYADNIKYLNLISTEELGGTIEAYTYSPSATALQRSLKALTSVSRTERPLVCATEPLSVMTSIAIAMATSCT